MCMGFHPESGGICINENSGYHCFQGYPLVCLIPLYIIFKPRGSESPSEVWFPCYLLLHHSQTLVSSEKQCSEFEYHLLLHHSQTSNSKMKCYHLHKTRYPSCVILIDFTTISIYNIPHSSFQASLFLTFHKQNFRLLISNFLNQFLYLFICQIAPDIYENKYLC